MGKFAEGRYEAAENVLHLWYAAPIHLDSEALLREFFEDARDNWIRRCPERPYLLVNYANVTFRPDMVDAYVRQIASFQDLVLGTYRYGLGDSAHGHFTAVAVHLGTMKLSKPANVFASEAEARAAILRATQ